jgi:hypothetical protein
MIGFILLSFFTLAVIGVPVGIVVGLTTLFGGVCRPGPGNLYSIHYPVGSRHAWICEVSFTIPIYIVTMA